jgi:hypothetical protein
MLSILSCAGGDSFLEVEDHSSAPARAGAVEPVASAAERQSQVTASP